MSVKGLPAMLNKFRYEDRSSLKAKMENRSSSGASSSSRPRATILSMGHRDDTSDSTDIDESKHDFN